MSLWRRVFRERRSVVLPLLVLFLANVAAMAIGIFPLSRHVAGLDNAAIEADLALKLARADAIKAQQERDAKGRAETDLKKFYSEILPRSFAQAHELTNYFLSKSARENNLQYESGQFRPVRPDDTKATRLTRMTGDATLKGDYQNIRRFLYRLETAEEFVIVEEVVLNQPGGAQAGGTLELNLIVSTYFLGSPLGAGAQ